MELIIICYRITYFIIIPLPRPAIGPFRLHVFSVPCALSLSSLIRVQRAGPDVLLFQHPTSDIRHPGSGKEPLEGNADIIECSCSSGTGV